MVLINLFIRLFICVNIVSVFFFSFIYSNPDIFVNKNEERYIKEFYRFLKDSNEREIIRSYLYKLKHASPDSFQIHFLKYISFKKSNFLIGILGKKFKFTDLSIINELKEKLDYSEYYKNFNNFYLFSFNGEKLFQSKVSKYKIDKAAYISQFEIKDYLNKGFFQIYLEVYVFPLSKKDKNQNHIKYLYIYDINQKTGKFKLLFSHPIYHHIKKLKKYNEVVNYKVKFRKYKNIKYNILTMEKITKLRFYKRKVKSHFYPDYTEKIIEKNYLNFVYDQNQEIIKPINLSKVKK